MKYLLSALLLSITISVSGQKIVLEQHTRDLFPEQNTNGPNLKHFKHAYIEYGFLIDDDKTKGVSLLTARSNTFAFGVRYKRKLAEFFSIGYALEYRFEDFAIRQEAGKIFPNSTLHSREKLNFNNLGAELYTRFNLGQRGNTLGFFIDLGAYGNWTFTAKHKTYDIFDDYQQHAKEMITTYKHLDFVEPIHYGARARIGYNRNIISVSYRISGYINDTFDVFLPQIAVAYQVGLH